MEDREISRWLEAGRRHLERGSHHAAIDAFRRVLSHDPDHADAHGFLALALVEAKRIHAASLEAGRALGGDPESPFAHLASAVVAHGQRRWEDARKHMDAARAFAPLDAGVAASCAGLLLSMDEAADAKEAALRALELDPDVVGPRVTLAEIARKAGEHDEAVALVEEALAADSGDVPALIVRGYLHLDRGEIADAREHAAMALRESPGDEHALRLLVAVKVRSSPATGLWWRFNAFVSGGSRQRAVAILVGMYLLKSLAILMLGDLGLEGAADLVKWAWIALCVYTWVAPSRFEKALQEELRSVRLDERF